MHVETMANRGACEKAAIDVLYGHRVINPDKIVIACLGDSITAGVGASEASRSYPSQLQYMLGESYEVINLGACSSSMMHSADDPYIRRLQWQAALQCNANIFVIMLGTNDARPNNWAKEGLPTAEVFEADYAAMIRQLQQLPRKPRIYTATPPPLYEIFPPVSSLHAAVAKFVQTVINEDLPTLVTNISRQAGLHSDPIGVFDALGGSSLAHPEWSGDGCHPNDLGYSMIARTIQLKLDSDGFPAGLFQSSSCKLMSTWALIPCFTAIQFPQGPDAWLNFSPQHVQLLQPAAVLKATMMSGGCQTAEGWMTHQLQVIGMQVGGS